MTDRKILLIRNSVRNEIGSLVALDKPPYHTCTTTNQPKKLNLFLISVLYIGRAHGRIEIRH
jgi:hypothetical protein